MYNSLVMNETKRSITKLEGVNNETVVQDLPSSMFSGVFDLPYILCSFLFKDLCLQSRIESSTQRLKVKLLKSGILKKAPLS